MSTKSVYLPDPRFEGDVIRITDVAHRHLVVARAEEGETIEVFDGQGNVWTAVVVSVVKRETAIRITASRHVDRDPHELVLGQALIRTAAFELVLEKAVEVGVTRILPLIAHRSNNVPGRRMDRWIRIVVEAAKQSKRYHLPTVGEPVRFDEILSFHASSKIMFAERDGGPLEPAIGGSPVLYLIGPEGGWTNEELDAGRQNGFAAVGLGSGILRSETAAIVGGALIRYELERRGANRRS